MKRSIFALGTAIALLALAFGLPSSPTPAAGDVLRPQALTQSGDGASIADVTARAMPSVVNVSTKRVVSASSSPFDLFSPFERDPFFRDRPNRRDRKRYGRSLGSGVIVSADGYILTNNHVVTKATDIEVSLADGREYSAKLIGSDPKSDLAVLKLEGEVKNLQPIEFADSSDLRLGDVVLAIGNPFGVGQTVTMGIVSAKGRANVGIVDYEDFIQTDAAINPGNSGGALVNMKGQLVGINTAILSRSGGYQGIGFAIPSNMAEPIMNSLVENGHVVRGWLGVQIQPLDRDLAQALDLNQTRGVLISNVLEGSPAERAGLRRGDVVVALDGKALYKVGELRNAIASAGANKQVTLELVRDGEKKRVRVELGQLTDESAKAPMRRDGGDGEDADPTGLGLTLRSLDQELRSKLDVPGSVRGGVVVTSVDPRGQGAQLGLRPGNVILEVNRKRISSPEELARAYRDAGSRVALLVFSQGSTVYLGFRK